MAIYLIIETHTFEFDVVRKSIVEDLEPGEPLVFYERLQAETFASDLARQPHALKIGERRPPSYHVIEIGRLEEQAKSSQRCLTS